MEHGTGSFEQKSLKQLFTEGKDLYDQLENNSTNEMVKQAISIFENVTQLIDSAALFSSNDVVDDIATSNLKYLLVHYYLSELFQKLDTRDSKTGEFSNTIRVQNLIRAKKQIEKFFNRVEKLGIASKEEIKAFHRDEPLSAAQLREEKKARFLKDKQANARLKELLQKQKDTQKKVDSNYVVKQNEGEEDDEDENEREVYLLMIQIAIGKSLEDNDALTKELNMLLSIEKLKLQNGGTLPKPEPPKPSALPKTFTITPNSIVNLKQEKMKEVWKPGYNLPTMTVEQWAEEQIKLGLLPSKDTQPPPQKKEEKDEDKPEDEEELKKKRAFDDWKDENPRGWGNMNDNYFKRS